MLVDHHPGACRVSQRVLRLAPRARRQVRRRRRGRAPRRWREAEVARNGEDAGSAGAPRPAPEPKLALLPPSGRRVPFGGHGRGKLQTAGGRGAIPVPATAGGKRRRLPAAGGRVPPAESGRCRGTPVLNLPQKHPADGVVRVLRHHQLRPAPGGQDVLLQVRLVDALPDSRAVCSASASESVAYRWKYDSGWAKAVLRSFRKRSTYHSSM